jgi:hypothetical protein
LKIENKKDKLKDIVKGELDVLGYVDIIDKKYAGYCVAIDLNVDYSPRIQLYPLANGNVLQVKVNKKVFSQNPIKRGDIIHVTGYDKKPKMKKINGEWTKLDEKEWWISQYQVS